MNMRPIGLCRRGAAGIILNGDRGAGRKPKAQWCVRARFPSMVPSFVIETVVTLVGCTAAIPFRRVLWRRRLGPPTILGGKDEPETQENETRWSRWCSSHSQLHRAPGANCIGYCQRHRSCSLGAKSDDSLANRLK